jgi:putative ABC transport system permease protein
MTILRDARLGVRLLWRQPGSTIVALLTLAIGIAANATIFTVVYSTLIAPLPYKNGDRIVMVWSRLNDRRNMTSAGNYVEWLRQSRSFDGLNAWTGRLVSLAAPGGPPEQVQARLGTPGHIDVHGFEMFLGRDFLPEEGTVGRDRVVILAHRFWQTRFGGDPDILDRELRVDGVPHKVVGVLAPGVPDRLGMNLCLPIAFKPEQITHDFRWLLVMGRLKPEVTVAQANAEMSTIARRLAVSHPDSNTGWTATVEPLKNNFLGPNLQTTLWLMLGAVGFVLLIACANVANLMLARGAARQRELAVRASLGASRGRLFVQLLTESLVLAGAGGLAGLVLAFVTLDGLLALLPVDSLPSEPDMRMHWPVLLFTLMVSMLSGVLFGCAPLAQIRRLNLQQVLKAAGRSTIGGGQRVRRALVIAEVALALTLLAGAGLATTSLVKLTTLDLGFKPDHLLTFALPLPADRVESAEQLELFYRLLLQRLRALPGVSSVSASTGMPLRSAEITRPFSLAGRQTIELARRPSVGFTMVTPDYFATFGIPISRGRAFTDRDTASAPRVAIVNDAFVRQYLEGLDPLTQRLTLERLIPGTTRVADPVEWQIVGVYPGVRNAGPRGEFPEIHVPFAQSPWPTTRIAVRSSLPPDTLRASAAAIVQSLDPDLPIADVKTMAQRVEESLEVDRFQAVLFGGFALVALVLAALGIYGVMAFTVAHRTHEIGLRMALGAGRDRVVWHILREGLATAAIGAILGSVGAYLVGRAMRGLLFDVAAIDPLAFAIVTLLLLSAAAIACAVPAWRAATVDPMVALRDG